MRRKVKDPIFMLSYIFARDLVLVGQVLGMEWSYAPMLSCYRHSPSGQTWSIDDSSNGQYKDIKIGLTVTDIMESI